MIHHLSVGNGGKADVWSWMQQKQALEVQLAWEIVDVFSSDVMLGPLNKKCLEGIKDIYEFIKNPLKDGIASGLDALKKAVQKEKALAVIGRFFTADSPEQYREALYRMITVAERGGLDLNGCCEFIRFYGEFCEQAKIAGIPRYVQADGVRQQYKKDGGDEGFIWGKKELPPDSIVKYGDLKLHGGRIRDKLHEWDDINKKTLGIKAEYQNRRLEMGPVREFLRSMGGGLDVWIEREGSTIEKVNSMFGLTSGADISGTTTDTAWYIDQFALGKISPIFYLLPLSYIVAVGHHTTLEVGAALTVTERAQARHLRPLNIHYSIGSYTTLLPGLLGEIPQEGSIASDIHPVSAGARAIKKKLEIAQHDARNRFILIYYDQGSSAPAGCIEFNEPGDRQLFKKMATVSQNFLSWFRNMRFARPSYSDVAAFISYFGGKSIDHLTAKFESMRSGMLYGIIAHTRRTGPPRIGETIDVIPYDPNEIEGVVPGLGKKGMERMLRSRTGKGQFIPLTVSETELFEKGQFKPGKDIIKVSGKYWIET